MPFIRATTNAAISAKKATHIKEKLGEAIALIPGKSESWLMMQLADEATLFFKGEDDPCAMVEVMLYGSAEEEDYAALTEKITDILHEELDLDPDRVYVTFSEHNSWGWNAGLL